MCVYASVQEGKLNRKFRLMNVDITVKPSFLIWTNS